MNTYVYLLRREDGSPFYVGKGAGARAWKHIHEARRGIDYNPHKSRIIRKMLARGVEPGVEIVAEFTTDEDAYAFEANLIEQIGRCNVGTGPLVNITAGGEGVVGYPQTPEIREAKRLGAHKRYSDPEQLRWAGDNLRRRMLTQKPERDWKRVWLGIGKATAHALGAARRPGSAGKIQRCSSGCSTGNANMLDQKMAVLLLAIVTPPCLRRAFGLTSSRCCSMASDTIA